jgi:hypothetical protein
MFKLILKLNGKKDHNKLKPHLMISAEIVRFHAEIKLRKKTSSIMLVLHFVNLLK